MGGGFNRSAHSAGPFGMHFVDRFLDALGLFCVPLGVDWVSLGCFGDLVVVPGVSWGVLGWSLGFLVASGAVPGIFGEIIGAILKAIWIHLRSKFSSKFH